MVGYPLDAEGRAARHCGYIEAFLEAVAAKKVFRNVPITLVNEYNSSMLAKAQIMKLLQEENHKEMNLKVMAKTVQI